MPRVLPILKNSPRRWIKPQGSQHPEPNAESHAQLYCQLRGGYLSPVYGPVHSLWGEVELRQDECSPQREGTAGGVENAVQMGERICMIKHKYYLTGIAVR